MAAGATVAAMVTVDECRSLEARATERSSSSGRSASGSSTSPTTRCSRARAAAPPSRRSRTGWRWPRRASRCSTSAPSPPAAGRRSPPEEEAAQLVPAIEGLVERGRACRSRPTPSRPRSPRAALRRRARSPINDICGGRRSGALRARAPRPAAGWCSCTSRDRPARTATRPRYEDPVEHLQRWFARAARGRGGARRRRGADRARPRARLRPRRRRRPRDPAPAATSCARSAGRCTSRSRARTCSARCSPAPGRSACPPSEREWATAAATALAVAERRRHPAPPRPQRPAGDADRGRDPLSGRAAVADG